LTNRSCINLNLIKVITSSCCLVCHYLVLKDSWIDSCRSSHFYVHL
jgi:hypothetical protein